jgi:hypothetical protein
LDTVEFDSRDNMLAVFADERLYAARVAATMAEHEPMLLVDSWECLEAVIPSTTCTVVVLGWLRGTADEARLRDIRFRHPRHPIILVTSKSADNALALRWLAVEDVVWLSELERALWPAVQRGHAQALMHDMAAAVSRTLPADHLISRAIAYACRASPPLRSIAQLAAVLACDRRTLWRHWRLALAAGSTFRLEDVLDWMLLLHAVGLKLPERSWAHVAGELHVHPHTLGRIAVRLTGRPLRILGAADQLRLAHRCQAELMHALLGRGAGGESLLAHSA